MKFCRVLAATTMIAVVTAFSVSLSGCSGDTKDQYKGQSARYIYAKGHTYLKSGDYAEAVKAFESLNSQYPFEHYSQKGDLELVYAYYQQDDPALALAAAERYLKLYPNNPNAAYAYYMSGVIDFNNGRGVLQKYFPYDMSEHMASNYDTAYQTLDIVLKRYPNSPYVSDARRRMIYLKNIMAKFQLNTAEFYYERDAYVAALARAKRVILHFPRSSSVLGAIQLSEQCYIKLGLPKLAASMQKLYAANSQLAD